jgi:hypothetical protein
MKSDLVPPDPLTAMDLSGLAGLILERGIYSAAFLYMPDFCGMNSALRTWFGSGEAAGFVPPCGVDSVSFDKLALGLHREGGSPKLNGL